LIFQTDYNLLSLKKQWLRARLIYQVTQKSCSGKPHSQGESSSNLYRIDKVVDLHFEKGREVFAWIEQIKKGIYRTPESLVKVNQYAREIKTARDKGEMGDLDMIVKCPLRGCLDFFSISEDLVNHIHSHVRSILISRTIRESLSVLSVLRPSLQELIYELTS
jgi:hypothetical protein